MFKTTLFLLLFILFTYSIFSQDTTEFTTQEIQGAFKDAKERNELPENLAKINKIDLLYSTFKQMRKDTVNRLPDGYLKPEYLEFEKKAVDTLLTVFNYNSDSLKLFRKDFDIFEKNIHFHHGQYNRQLFYLLHEKILPSFLVFFPEFKYSYAELLKILTTKECCGNR